MEELNNSVPVQETATAEVSSREQTQENVSSSTPVDNTVASPSATEKSFSQDEVNKLIGAAKLKERERYVNSQDNYQSHEFKNNHQLSAQDFDIGAEVKRVLQQAQEELEAQRAYEEAQNIINNFSHKVISGKDKYDDFDQKLSHVNLENPSLIMSLKDLDNPADVLYELGKDPSTYLEVVNGLSSPYTSAAAKAKVQKIANVVKNNEQARELHNRGQVPSKMKSSPVSTGNQRPSHSEMLRSKDFTW